MVEVNRNCWIFDPEIPMEYTKKVDYGKRKYTSINPHYQIMQATEKWGSYGGKWGVRDCKHSYRDVVIEKTDRKTGEVTEETKAQEICLDAVFFYPGDDGQEISFEISVDAIWVPHGDNRKKLLTDLTTKALSKLGSGASIFLGELSNPENRRKPSPAGQQGGNGKLDPQSKFKQIESCLTEKQFSMLMAIVKKSPLVQSGKLKAYTALCNIYQNKFPDVKLPDKDGVLLLNHITKNQVDAMKAATESFIEQEFETCDDLPF